MMRWLYSIGVALVLLTAPQVRAAVPAEPVIDDDVVMQADRATLVQTKQGQLLLLEGDVRVSMGGYGFRDKQVLVRIRKRSKPGKTVRDFAFIFEKPESVGKGGVKAEGAGLLVTAASRGKVELKAFVNKADAIPQSTFTRKALARFADYDKNLGRPLGKVPDTAPLTPEQIKLREKRRAEIEKQRRTVEVPDPDAKPGKKTDSDLVARAVLPKRGTLRYASVKRIVYQSGEKEDTVTLLGGVRVMYQDRDEDRDVLLKAEKIVIFLAKDDKGGAPSGQIDAGRVRGVYLEDSAVVSDGNITVRAPRAFYELTTNRAILLDAVIYSYDLRTRVPLYMRARVIRQTSADSFSAQDAVFTTSEFGKPHLSIGASKITLQQEQRIDGSTDRWVSASDVAIKAGDTPLFYWPYAKLRAGAVPIRRIKVGFQGDNGSEVQTTWDLFALSNNRGPDGVELLGNIDYRGEHGLGLGVDLDYDRDIAQGSFEGYFLPNDSGTDELADRNGVGFDGKARGFFRGLHRQDLPAGWEVWAEASYVSDPTFLEEFFPNKAYAERAFENSIFFKKAEDDWAVTGLVKGETNDFLAQYPELLTPGYTVNKLPEVEYRLMKSVFGDAATLFHESRVSRMRMVFGDDSPASRGFTPAQSAAAFGTANTTSFQAAALAQGLPTEVVNRLDTRTELTAPTRAGIFDITPFVVGRVTAYDEDFTTFNGGNNDQARLWGGGGVRASTQFSNANRNITSRLFDVQGIRHIIEPGVSAAYYGTTLSAANLPVFDPDVERLADGGIARIGMVNTLQTKRGGPGRQRTVDWLTLRTDLVLVSDTAPNPLSIGRYYDYRPEYTLGDDHFYAELMWAATEATAFTGEVVHSFDQGSISQWRAGIENKHSDRLSTNITYREIDALDARLLSYGAALELTRKYRLGLYQVIDFGEGNSRTLNVTLDRRIPRATLSLNLGYDEIDGEATFAIVITPQGGASTGGFFGP